MKKGLIALLSSLMLLGLATGCSNEEMNNNNDETETNAEESNEE